MDKILEKVKEYWKMIVLVVCGLIAGGIFYVLTNGQKPTTNLSVENLSSVSRQSSVSKFSEPNEKSVSKIMVDLKGAVTKPNVYQISSDERLVDLIKEAGGFTDQADQKSINLSAKLKDEEVIYVPKIGENSSTENTDSSANSVTSQVSTTTEKININQADLTELQKLTGVGQKKAQDIIDFRTENGDFKSLEDLGKVSGFGDKTLEKLKDELCFE